MNAPSAAQHRDNEEVAFEIKRGNLRHQLARVAQCRPEHVRSSLMIVALSTNLDQQGLLLPHEECFIAVYEKGGSRRFWEIQLSLPMNFECFVDVMALTSVASEDRLKMYEHALRNAILDAAHMGEEWLTGDTADLRKLSYGWQVKAEGIRVNPRPAVEWLLRVPELSYLVPPSLVAFLSPRAEPAPTQIATNATYRTGAPGHPTSMHLIKHELERRAGAKEMITISLAKEAAYLANWLKDAHPLAAPIKAKTIQNQLGETWRSLGGRSIPKRNVTR